MILTNAKSGAVADFAFECVPLSSLRMVVECLEGIYGGEENYVYPDMFHMDYLQAAAGSGQIRCYLAVHGGVPAATMTARRNEHFEGSLELSAMGICPAYRGFGLLDPFLRYVMDDCARRGDALLYAHAVTYATASQLALERVGFAPTGLMPGAVASGLHLSQMGVRNPKFVLGVYVRDMAARASAPELYLPEPLAGAAASVYRRLGATPVIHTQPAHPAGATRISCRQSERHKALYVYAWQMGGDVVRALERALLAYTDPLQTVLVMVDINRPDAVWGANRLLQAGYRFGGFKPLYGEREFLILYNTLSVRLDFSQLCASEQLRALIALTDEGNAAYG